MAERIRVSLYRQSPQVFESLAQQFVDALKDSISRADAIASGELYDSIGWTIEENDETLNIKISAADQLMYVVRGRRPGKWPPVNAIKDWTRHRGIPESAAWPIAYKIFAFGIEPRPQIFETVFEILDTQLIQDFGIQLADNLEDLLVRVLENIEN